MNPVRSGEAKRGSQRSLQRAVNEHATILDQAIISASHGKILGPIAWRSPLRANGYEEYCDQKFLDCLDIRLTKRPLATFWPSNGPNWDALGVAADGTKILVEAKSHPSETQSRCAATAPASLDRIRDSLAEVQRHLGVDPPRDWMSQYYQYANRLAHLYLLREQNAIPAHLVFLYFVGDTGIKVPPSREAWTPTRRAIHEALGIRDELPYVIDAYLDVRSMPAPTESVVRNR